MSSIMRWEPFRDLMSYRDAMDRMFDEVLGRTVSAYAGAHVPAVDMYQTPDEVVVKATLPGLKAEDINISITADVLTIRGETKQEREVSEASYHLRERRVGAFSRSIPLPSTVTAEKAKAEFENGVLTLSIPKAEEVKPKTITVKAK